MNVHKGDVVRLSPKIQQDLYRAGCANSLECWEVLKAHNEMLTLTPVLSDNYKLAFIQIKAEHGSVSKVRVIDS